MLVITSGFPLFAQNANETFGKNRIQYRNFDWKYITSENFEVYYYGEGGNLAREATQYLEDNFDRITDLMGYAPYSKTKIFLYNSQTEMLQSNVGINFNGPISGGETQFVPSNIEIAHPGTLDGFKEELLYRVTRLLLDEMLFGGSIKDMLQNSFTHLPEWLVEGAALYISKGWTMEMDDYVRDYLRNTNNVKLQNLGGTEAGLAGQSIWNYISERHGKSNISSILNYIKIIRNEEKSIAITLGISFREMMIDWKRFYLEMDSRLDATYTVFPKEFNFTGRNRKSLVYKNAHFSPDGMKIAYSRNDRGRYSVIVYDVASGDEVTVIKEGSRVVNQKVDYNLPLMAWVDDNTLGVVDASHGKNTFWLYDVVSSSKIPRVLENITEVNSISFNQNGRLGIMSATVNGFSDLYLFSTRRESIKRLTNDFYDDIDPSFVPGTNTLVFSSNRTTDTLNIMGKDLDKITGNYNLYFYNLDTTKNVVKRITNTISRDSEPLALNYDEILYLSDQRGIKNLFKFKISSGIYSQLTNFKSSIEEFHYNDATRSLVIVGEFEGKDNIYYIKDFDINVQKFTPPSGRQQVLQAKMVRERRETQQQIKEVSMKELLDAKLQELDKSNVDSLKNSAIDTAGVEPVKDSTAVQQESLDTENFRFEQTTRTENSTVAQTPRNESFLTQYRKLKRTDDISGPKDYETLFRADKIVTTAVIDQLRGFGLSVETSMYDLLENHSFTGGLMSTTDFRNGDIWAEYKYLKGRIDYSVRFDRRVLYWSKAGDLIASLDKYSSNKLLVSASYPFNAKSRVSLNPFLMRTVYDDLGKIDQNGFPSRNPTFVNTMPVNYAGAEIEMVFDNSILADMNLKDGTKAKLKISHFQSLSGNEKSFGNVRAEIRHYQKIHREIHIAARGFYGFFFGNAKKSYLLGGVDNWLLNQRNTSEENNPLNREIAGDRSDLLFAEFVSPIRGFDYSELFGSDVLAFNAELRLPLIKYLNSNYIPSNFFRNLQLIGFFDVGSAWTGISPFNPENTISTVKLPTEGAFEITLDNFKNPWLMSYGVGFRTMMLGYYVKFDLAWPIIDFAPADPRLSVSLGFDF